MNLKRLKDLPADFPVSLPTLYKWNHYGKYPKLLVKLGGMLCVDLDEIPNTITRKNIPIRKEKRDV